MLSTYLWKFLIEVKIILLQKETSFNYKMRHTVNVLCWDNVQILLIYFFEFVKKHAFKKHPKHINLNNFQTTSR